MVAFRQVLARKQAQYGPAIRWLEEETLKLSSRRELNRSALVRVAMSSVSYKI